MKAKFSGHQTFVFRYGWLEKGYRFVKAKHSFSDKDAIVNLGVGKNMVESIRYWCEVTGITKSSETTGFGNLLLDEKNGWDPYLENLASLWLLHWKLNTIQDYLHSGGLIFSHIHKPEFSKNDIVEVIEKTFRTRDSEMPSENILNRDIDCYLRLYVGTRRGETSNKEEAIGSPMEELNLIQHLHGSELFRFNIGEKMTLPYHIIGYAIWEYMKKANKVSITIQEALYAEYSPGQLFMLDENSLVEAIEFLGETQQWANAIGFSESAGIATIYCSIVDGTDLLKSYYQGEESL